MQYFELVSFFLKTICVKLEACVCVCEHGDPYSVGDMHTIVKEGDFRRSIMFMM